ncbi:hypothetical protein J1N35_021821 [Gossypium stocksii]|uniref:Uncharacterized protein n=1 Tax=Gossypium stocksii TaxID=47602 RepID=A0A9D4A2B6_9ROSI|nr:hypothetical protein J1N35_021821 [Gossypium stocksii]
MGKALGVGSSVRGAEAKDVESEKKPKCLKKFVIKRDAEADKKSKKFILSKEKLKPRGQRGAKRSE